MLAVEKTAYLTIDDGPAGDFIQKVDHLNEIGVQAIWFCMGEGLEQFSDEAVYAIKHGHMIGHRGYNHADFSKMSMEDGRVQLERADKQVEEIYTKAGISIPLKMFRLPYLQHEMSSDDNAAMEIVLGERGYTQPSFESRSYTEQGLASSLHVGCTCDTFDLANIEAAGEAFFVDNTAEVIRIHDWISLESFKALIERTIEQGLAYKLPDAKSLSFV